MARTAHNATWRALRRIVDTLDANVATELAADGPAGLNVAAPASEAYYALPGEQDVRYHVERNHYEQVYVFPSSERVRTPRTRGATTQSSPTTFDVTIAVRVVEEAGADDYAETWKTLTPKEREFLRCETLLGAIQDVMDSQVRNTDDVLHVEFVSSATGDRRFKTTDTEPGTWGVQVWTVHQIILIPQQN